MDDVNIDNRYTEHIKINPISRTIAPFMPAKNSSSTKRENLFPLLQTTLSQGSMRKKVRTSLKAKLKRGLMYQHPLLYELAMWMNDPTRLIMKTIAKRIAGRSVLDLGCGTASLQLFLPEGIDYIGLDLNEDFLTFAEKKSRGVVFKRDILKELNGFEADTVVLSDVLHHVTPHHQVLLENALTSAREKVVISACYEKESGAFKDFSTILCRKIIDNDGFNEARAKAGWLTLEELLQFLKEFGATNFHKVLSHIQCEIKI